MNVLTQHLLIALADLEERGAEEARVASLRPILAQIKGPMEPDEIIALLAPHEELLEALQQHGAPVGVRLAIKARDAPATAAPHYVEGL